MIGITKFALGSTRLVIALILIICLGGVYFFTVIPKLEDPSITIREIVVVARHPGMPVEQVERLITRPIEEKLRTVGEVDDIENSTSTRGQSLIHVTIRDEVSAEQLPMVWKLIRNKVDDVKGDLPKGTIGPVVNDSFGDTAVATIALWSEGFSMAEMYESARKVCERLNVMDGVQKIEMTGAQEERIYIEFSNTKLFQYGLNVASVVDALAQQNILLPAGSMNLDNVSLSLEVQGRFKTVGEIEDALINIPGTETSVMLREFATVRRGYVDPAVEPAYYNGHQAIVLSVFLLDGTDAIRFGELLKAKVHKLESGMPLGYKLDFATFQPKLIQKSVNGMVSNVGQSVAIVLTVVMLLLGMRAGLIVGSFIPLIMLFGVVMMGFFNIEMQRMSLATMIIALGMFVDNAIVVSDDVKMKLIQGSDAKTAALEVGTSLAIPLLTSTLTTVFAFGPIILQVGSTGDYTSSLGSVMIILLLGSWFFSLLYIPLMCVWFLKIKPSKLQKGDSTAHPVVASGENQYQGRFYNFYRAFLRLCLRNKVLVISLTALMFLGAVFAMGKVPQSFFPEGERNQFLIYVDLPAGTRINQTDQTIRDICRWLQDKDENPEITKTIAYVGNGGPRFFLSLNPVDPKPYSGFIIVNTKNSDQVRPSMEHVNRYLLANFPEVFARVKSMFLGPTEPGVLKIRLSGPESETLLAKNEALMAGLRKIPGTINVMNDWYNRVPVGVIDVDQVRARRAGVTSQEVAHSLESFYDGRTVTNFSEGNVEIPILSRGVKDERDIASNLETTGIYSASRQKIAPLNQVADFRVVGDLDRIVRYNQERTITVSAFNPNMKASELFVAVKPVLRSMNLSDDYYWEVGGEIESSSKAQQKLGKWLPLCLGAMMLLLVWQFNSFRRASIVMLTIPLVLVGTVVGLIAMQADFGFMVILGMLALAGSIVNNGIVMIDRIETNRQAGLSDLDAVIDSAVSRFRPILLSVSTTMLGFLPLILGHDPLFYSMSCVMFFGLGIGSMFTLNFVPCMYALLFGVDTKRC